MNSKYNRINVIATTGSGKTTFCKKLSSILKIEHIEMDALYWKNDWKHSTEIEFFEKLETALDNEKWILDGKYNRTQHIKWKNVDTIIWLDYPFYLILYRSIKRSISRLIDKKPMWNTNNTESFRNTYLSKDSILIWMLKTYPKNKIRYRELMNDVKYKHINIIHLRSPKESNSFIDSLNKY